MDGRKDQDADKGAENEDDLRAPDRVPRQSVFASLPKRSVMRVLMLLGVLAGILYLRERTASIAGCMSNAFQILPPAPPPSGAPGPARARIELRRDAAPEAPRPRP